MQAAFDLFPSALAGTTYQARPYQHRIVGKVVDMFNGTYTNERTGVTPPRAKSVMLESPTGSGKSMMGLTAIKILQTHFDPDLFVAWMAMRRDLLRQIVREMHDTGMRLNNFHPISMFEKEPHELIAAKKAGRKIVFVSDECQHDSTASSAHLHNIIEPDYVLGMSATPYRLDRVKLMFDSVVRDCGIHQLIQDGFLSKFDHFSLPNWNVKTVAEAYMRDPDQWGKSIFYFKNLDECYALERILRENFACHRRNVEVVTGETDREAQIARFKSGESQLLINCMVLTEGFNEPSIRTAFIRDSGKGTTIQMGGRAFRIFPELNCKQIVQSKLTRWPFIRTAMPQTQYIWQENCWRSLTVNPHITEINRRAMVAVMETPVELPKFIIDKGLKKKKARFPQE